MSLWPLNGAPELRLASLFANVAALTAAAVVADPPASLPPIHVTVGRTADNTVSQLLGIAAVHVMISVNAMPATAWLVRAAVHALILIQECPAGGHIRFSAWDLAGTGEHGQPQTRSPARG